MIVPAGVYNVQNNHHWFAGNIETYTSAMKAVTKHSFLFLQAFLKARIIVMILFGHGHIPVIKAWGLWKSTISFSCDAILYQFDDLPKHVTGDKVHFKTRM